MHKFLFYYRSNKKLIISGDDFLNLKLLEISLIFFVFSISVNFNTYINYKTRIPTLGLNPKKLAKMQNKVSSFVCLKVRLGRSRSSKCGYQEYYGSRPHCRIVMLIKMWPPSGTLERHVGLPWRHNTVDSKKIWKSVSDKRRISYRTIINVTFFLIYLKMD